MRNITHTSQVLALDAEIKASAPPQMSPLAPPLVGAAAFPCHASSAVADAPHPCIENPTTVSEGENTSRTSVAPPHHSAPPAHLPMMPYGSTINITIQQAPAPAHATHAAVSGALDTRHSSHLALEATTDASSDQISLPPSSEAVGSTGAAKPVHVVHGLTHLFHMDLPVPDEGICGEAKIPDGLSQTLVAERYRGVVDGSGGQAEARGGVSDAAVQCNVADEHKSPDSDSDAIAHQTFKTAEHDAGFKPPAPSSLTMHHEPKCSAIETPSAPQEVQQVAQPGSSMPEPVTSACIERRHAPHPEDGLAVQQDDVPILIAMSKQYSHRPSSSSGSSVGGSSTCTASLMRIADDLDALAAANAWGPREHLVSQAAVPSIPVGRGGVVKAYTHPLVAKETLGVGPVSAALIRRHLEQCDQAGVAMRNEPRRQNDALPDTKSAHDDYLVDILMQVVLDQSLSVPLVARSDDNAHLQTRLNSPSPASLSPSDSPFQADMLQAEMCGAEMWGARQRQQRGPLRVSLGASSSSGATSRPVRGGVMPWGLQVRRDPHTTGLHMVHTWLDPHHDPRMARLPHTPHCCSHIFHMNFIPGAFPRHARW